MSIPPSRLRIRRAAAKALAETVFAAKALAAALFLAVGACGGEDPGGGSPPPPAAAWPFDTLSAYGFFAGDIAQQSPAPAVIPYEVAAALWSDGAEKKHFLVVPEGGAVEWAARDPWELPPGSVVLKSFHFPEDRRQPGGSSRIIETRLLIRQESGWTGHIYIWDEDQREARRIVAGRRVNIDFIDEGGKAVTQEYIVPNTNHCKSCHARDDKVQLLGVMTPQMNRDVLVNGAPVSQLDWLVGTLPWKTEPPPAAEAEAFPDPFGDGPLTERARAYLNGNCAHCHRPGGGGGDSGLVLLAWEESPAGFGVCKSPAAAGSGTGGHSYDIVPGYPEESIMIFRMGSTDPDIKMPELPNRLPDKAGIDLIGAWIAALDPKGCE